MAQEPIPEDQRVIGMGGGNGFAPALAAAPSVRVWATETAAFSQRADGRFVAWGVNDRFYNQIQGVPTDIQVRSVAMNSRGGRAVVASGALVTWGSNGVPRSREWLQMEGNPTYFLGLAADSTVDMSGPSQYGMRDIPTGLSRVASVGLGADHALAVRADGQVVAWGRNHFGQTDVPPEASGAVMAVGGNAHSAALLADGTVVAWGREGRTDVPSGLTDVVALTASNDRTFALRADGTVVGWGIGAEVPAGLSDVISISTASRYTLAALGDGSIEIWGDESLIRGVMSVPQGLDDVIDVETFIHTLAIREDRTLTAWGGDTTFTDVATVPEGLDDVVDIAVGSDFNLALRGDGTVTAWGRNARGQTDVPPGLGRVVAVAAGSQHGLALRADGTVAAWGLNTYGQTDVPPMLQNVRAIASSYDVSMALLADGTVRTWGLGLNPPPEGLRDVVAISGGAAHRLALRADNTVVAWGSNSQGQLDVPEGLTDAIAISAGDYFSFATRASGETVVWGTVPFQGFEADSLVDIAGGAGHVFAVSGGPGPIRIQPTSGPGDPPVFAVTPNPASGAVRVQLDAEESGPVTLDLLDVRGRRIATLLDGTPEASGGEVSFDVAAMDLAPGVYIVRLGTADGVSTVRIAVMR